MTFLPAPCTQHLTWSWLSTPAFMMLPTLGGPPYNFCCMKRFRWRLRAQSKIWHHGVDHRKSALCRIAFGAARNPFASKFMTPAEGKNLLRAGNLYLLGLQGMLKRFPKGGGVLDASHMEVMAMMTLQSVSTASAPAQQYILQERARSYVEFARALEARRPCVGQKLISEESPDLWKQFMAPLL